MMSKAVKVWITMNGAVLAALGAWDVCLWRSYIALRANPLMHLCGVEREIAAVTFLAQIASVAGLLTMVFAVRRLPVVVRMIYLGPLTFCACLAVTPWILLRCLCF
jgi:hypothetical protein